MPAMAEEEYRLVGGVGFERIDVGESFSCIEPEQTLGVQNVVTALDMKVVLIRNR